MMPPTLPPSFGLPPELKAEIEASVKRFEEKCGAFLMIAKANGYIDHYRKEITAVVVKAYNHGIGSNL